GRATELVLASWASVLPPTLAYVALALLLSIVSRSGIVGVLGPAVVGVAMQLLALIGPGEIVRAILPSTPFDAWHGLFVEPPPRGPLLQGALTSVLYTAILLAVGWYVLHRRAFAASDAVELRPWQLPVRAAVAAAAVIAVLVAVSGLGPSDMTSTRLESSITP